MAPNRSGTTRRRGFGVGVAFLEEVFTVGVDFKVSFAQVMLSVVDSLPTIA